MANAVADGPRAVGATIDIKRIPESVPGAKPQGAHFKREKSVPVAVIEDPANYDAIIVGCPARSGRMASQMAGFLDQAADLCRRGALNRKVGGAFTSPASHYGGQKSAALSILTNLLHFGMIILGPPYSAATMADEAGQRHPSPLDLGGAREPGITIAQTAQRLFG